MGLKKMLFSIGRCINTIRLILLNILFWGLVALLIYQFIPKTQESVKVHSILKIDIVGPLVDKSEYDLYPSQVSSYFEGVEQTSLYSLKKVLTQAKTDIKIEGISLDLSAMKSSSLANLEELRAMLIDYKKSGRPIYAWANFYNQSSYYIASVANKIYLDPMGEVSLSGFSSYSNYYRGFLDKWDVKVHVFKAGLYKSATEPYEFNSMSKPVKEEYSRWLNTQWALYQRDVEESRGLKAGTLDQFIESYPQKMLQFKEGSQIALKSHLVDKLVGFQGFSKDVFGEKKKEKNLILWQNYLSEGLNLTLLDTSSTKKVALITARGAIVSGQGRLNQIGSDSLISQLDSVLNNKDVKALVLRIDSPGGSAFAAEEIRRKIAEIRQEQIPVLISMGGVSASGGYWISSESDEIWALPGTITGSIGVFSIVPDFSSFLENQVGVYTDGVSTSWQGGQGALGIPLNKKSQQVYQASVNGTYDRFISLVVNSRKMTDRHVRSLAGGRVWTGSEAKKIGLVDHLGTLDQVVERAAELGHIRDNYSLWEVPEEEGYSFDSLLENLMGRALQKSSLSSYKAMSKVLNPLNQGYMTLEPEKNYALMY